MIEKFLYLLYNSIMSNYGQTRKYSIETFKTNLIHKEITEREFLIKGFKLSKGAYKWVKSIKKTHAFIVLESSKECQSLFPIALAIKDILQFYHIDNAGILFGDVKIIEKYLDELKNVDVLFVRVLFDNQNNFMPCDNVYMGKCCYEISPYPTTNLSKTELINIAKSCGLSCNEINGKIMGEQYFGDIIDLEKLLIDFAYKTSEFDKLNSVITRTIVNSITMPVKNNEYYFDLFSFLTKKTGKVEYEGIAGNVLSKHNGAMLCINVNNDKNVESFYVCLKTFLEEING